MRLCSTQLASSADVVNLLCPPVVALPPQLPLLKTILLDSYYFDYQVRGRVCAAYLQVWTV